MNERPICWKSCWPPPNNSAVEGGVVNTDKLAPHFNAQAERLNELVQLNWMVSSESGWGDLVQSTSGMCPCLWFVTYAYISTDTAQVENKVQTPDRRIYHVHYLETRRFSDVDCVGTPTPPLDSSTSHLSNAIYCQMAYIPLNPYMIFGIFAANDWLWKALQNRPSQGSAETSWIGSELADSRIEAS